MHSFHVYYRDPEDTLPRILNAISGRGLDLPYVRAEAVQAEPEPLASAHRVSLLLDLNPKQIGELCRDWHAIGAVVEVRAGAPSDDMMEFAEYWDAARRPAASAIGQSVIAAIG